MNYQKSMATVQATLTAFESKVPGIEVAGQDYRPEKSYYMYENIKKISIFKNTIIHENSTKC